MSVHRRDCANYTRVNKFTDDAGRSVRVTWADTENEKYQTGIHITARERAGLVVDIATILNSMHIKMTSFSAKEIENGVAFVSVIVEVRGRNELVDAMARLMSVSGVTEVRRPAG